VIGLGAGRCRATPHVLYVGMRIPTPHLDGGSARELIVLKALRNLCCSVTFACHSTEPIPPYPETLSEDTARLGALGVEVIVRSAAQTLEEHLTVRGREYDLVLLSPYSIADRYFSVVRTHAPKATVVYLALDLGHAQHFRRARVTGKVPDLQRAIAAKQCETRLARDADVTLVCSVEERDVMLSLCPTADVRLLSHVVEARGAPAPFSGRAGLLFLGSFPHLANVDAMEHFVRDIFPVVRKGLPGVTLQIVGSDPRGDVRHLAAEDIRVHGWVPDLAPYFDAAKVFVAPLRYGAGIKIKVLDSLAHGVPVVLSPIAAEGMHVTDGQNALLAPSPDAFAAAVIRLHGDEPLWNRLVEGGASTIERYFSWRVMEETLARLLPPERSQE
jgi:O-antigen biosynthesis protein